LLYWKIGKLHPAAAFVSVSRPCARRDLSLMVLVRRILCLGGRARSRQMLCIGRPENARGRFFRLHHHQTARRARRAGMRANHTVACALPPLAAVNWQHKC